MKLTNVNRRWLFFYGSLVLLIIALGTTYHGC